MRFRNLLTACVVGMLLAPALPIVGQGIVTGSLTGTVEDPSGAVVPGATVTAIDPTKGTPFKATVGSNGSFTLSTLPVGTYDVTIESSGFSNLSLHNVQVSTGKATGLGVEKLGVTAAATVEVSTAQALIETVQSQVTTTFTSQQVADLPVPGGGFDRLALLIPGVVSTHDAGFSNTNGAGLSSNGQRGRSNNFEIDGQSNNDNSVAGPQVFFSNPDAIQEVQIITNNFSAQYGRDAGSVINYITKSGTNQIHGTASYLYLGSWLSAYLQQNKSPVFGFCPKGVSPATGCTAPSKPRFDDNTFAATLGGPIIKDKLWGFGSGLIGRNYNGATPAFSGTVGGPSTGFIPNAAGLAALQAAYPNNPGVQSLVKFGPQAVQLGQFAYTGDPVTINVSDGTTTTPIQVQQYRRSINAHSTDEEVLGRLDFQATSHDRFFARYFFQDAPSFLATGNIATGGVVDVTDKTYSVGGDWSHTFGTRIVNTLRYSFQQARINFEGGGFSTCTASNFNACPASFGTLSSRFNSSTVNPAAGQPTKVRLGSFGQQTNLPQGRTVKDTQIQDNMTLTLGRHNIALGGAYEFQNSPNVFLPSISGAYQFQGFNGLLNGTGNLGLTLGSPKVHFTEPDYAAYFQDDWKVSSALTLNLGLRWEYFSQSINLLHGISLANQTGPNPLWSKSLPLSVTTFPKVPQDYKHFEPRIGFAYNPSGMKSLVIRGGYSINIAPAFYNIFLNSYGSAPVVLSSTITNCSNATHPCIPQGGASGSSVHALADRYLLNVPAGQDGLNPGSFNQTLVDKNFNQPLTQTYSFGIQKEVGRIGVAEVRYVGAHTSGDFQSIDANPYIADTVAAFPNYYGNIKPCATSTLPAFPRRGADLGRLHCGQSNVRARLNTAFEDYNGLQTSFNTRGYHGLTANFSYTYSKTIDNASEIFSTFGGGNTVAFASDPLNPNEGERAVSGQSYPNVTSLGLTFVDPHFRHSHSFVGRVLGGFQLNTIYLFNSGQPYSASQFLEGSFCDTAFNAAFIGADSCRPILVNAKAPIESVAIYGPITKNGPNVYSDYSSGQVITSTTDHWLINNQAAAIQAGTPFPGVGRNTLRGDSYNNLDASIFKNNKLSERFNLQLQLTVFNVLNRGYYGGPDPFVEDTGTFANVTNNNGLAQRNVQLGGRLLF